jgi:transposase
LQKSSYDELVAELVRLRQDNQDLRNDNLRLRAQLDELTKTLQETHRRSKRQAAPFSKGEPKAKPKKPGRKSGDHHGRHSHRLPLPDDQIDEHLQAPLPTACPHCAGSVIETHVQTQDQVELPARPRHRRFHIHCGHCQQCGKAVRGRHAEQTSDATGAAGSQVGPRAQALVVYLNKDAGLSHQKTARVLGQLGISLTPGASAQIMLRAARRLRPVYQEIRQHLAAEEHITPDETGWRLGGHPVWLHAWVGVNVTCFAIDPQRSADALAAVIGWQWSGTMTHDGCASYDRFQEAVHQQCVAHVLCRSHELEAAQSGAAKMFPRQVITLFQGALAVRDQFLTGALDATALEQAHEHYVQELLDLTEPKRTNAANDCLAKHLYGHGEQWLTFLLDPTVPATNHRAEQALRGPIVNRKVWGGNRTPAGGEAQSILSSTLATCKQQAVSFCHFLADTLCGLPRLLLGSTGPTAAAATAK